MPESASEDIQIIGSRAVILQSSGRYQEALECLLTLLPRFPRHPQLLSNLGVLYRETGELARSEECLRQACSLRPDNAEHHFNLAITLLLAGSYREGFAEYEWRWRVGAFQEQRRTFAQPLWDGAPLAGRRILLYAEQGAGDAIHFVRYAPLVRAAGGQVILEVLPAVEPLLWWMPGGYRTTTLLRQVEFDVQCPLMSLPHRLRTSLDSIPAPAQFLVPPEALPRWTRQFQAPVTKIGIVWAGNSNNPNDRFRSLPAELFLRLLDVPRVQLFSLQVGAESPPPSARITDPGPQLNNYADTAAVISLLDLVISVDTAVAHLAGSLGKPVWMLAAYVPDWRWMLRHEVTPWYASMRIFRQSTPGDWKSVFDRLIAELRSSPA